MLDSTRIAELIVKQLRNTLSDEEREELEAWIRESPKNLVFMETRMQLNQVLDGVAILLEREVDSTRPAAKSRTMTWYIKSIAIAAVLCGLAIGIVLFYRARHPKDGLVAAFTEKKLQEIEKVTDRPMLTLPDGKIIYLDTISKGIVWQKDGLELRKGDSQRIIYSTVANTAMSSTSSNIYYHTFSTPYGQSWKLLLPDHSQVQLNTGSTLSYPVTDSSLSSGKRDFFLHGEAFFEMVYDAHHAYVVTTRHIIATTLSTSFDIRDYPFQASCSAAVVRGAIRVDDGKKAMKVNAGEAVSIDTAASGMRLIRPYDSTKELSWRSDFFNFGNLNIRESMQELACWYGMEGVVIHRGVDTVSPGLLSDGMIQKSSRIDSLFENLGQDNGLHLWSSKDKKIHIRHL